MISVDSTRVKGLRLSEKSQFEPVFSSSNTRTFLYLYCIVSIVIFLFPFCRAKATINQQRKALQGPSYWRSQCWQNIFCPTLRQWYFPGRLQRHSWCGLCTQSFASFGRDCGQTTTLGRGRYFPFFLFKTSPTLNFRHKSNYTQPINVLWIPFESILQVCFWGH